MRKLLKRTLWIAGAVLIAAVPAVYWYWSNDEYLRQHIQAQLERQWPSVHVRLARARRNLGGGITLYSVYLSQSLPSGVDWSLEVPEASLEIDGDNPSGRTVKRVRLEYPRFRAVRQLGGDWNLAQLLSLDAAGPFPEVVIHQGTVEIDDGGPSRAEPAVAGVSGPGRRLQDAIGGTACGAEVPEGKPRGSDIVLRAMDAHLAPGKDGVYRAKGEFQSDFFQRAEITGEIDGRRKAWSVEGTIEQLRFGTELSQLAARWLRSVAKPEAAALDALESGARIERVLTDVSTWSLRGTGGAELTLRQPAPDAPLDYRADLTLKHGSLEAGVLPFPADDVEAVLRCHDGALEIVSLRGRNGATEFSGRGQLRLPFGGSTAAPVQPFLILGVGNLELDARLRNWLPADAQELWDHLQPRGRVKLDVAMLYENDRWRPQARLECLDASFAFTAFPYRLDHVTGVLLQEGRTIDLDLSGRGGDRLVRLTGSVSHPGRDARVQLDIQADSIRVDEQLLAATAPPLRKTLASFHPRGTIGLQWHLSREGAGQPYESHAVLLLKQCSLRWDGCPYPLEGVTGRVTLHNGTWRFLDLVGRHGGAEIKGYGLLESLAKGGKLDLTLIGRNVAFEPQLRDALPPRVQRVWDELDPAGRCDFRLALRREAGRALEVASLQLEPRDAAIRPRGFPYRLEGLQGEIFGAGTTWQLRWLDGRHGQTHVAARGQLELHHNGRGRLRLDELTADSVAMESELLGALPPTLAQGLRRLELGGQPLGLRTSPASPQPRPALDLEWRSQPDGGLRAAWNLLVDCTGTSLNFPGGPTNLHGSLALEGIYDGEAMRCQGELALDSATWQGLHFTDIRGPLRLDRSRLTLGSGGWTVRAGPGGLQAVDASVPPPTWVPPVERHLSAKLIGGQVLGDIVVLLGTPAAYAARAHLAGGSLEQFARESMPGRQRLRGRLNADFMVSQGLAAANRELLPADGKAGRGVARPQGQRDGPRGWGYLEAYDADLYELPPVLAMLNILSLKMPETPVFYQGEAYLQIEPDKVTLPRVNLTGDAISLRGRGEMDALTADSRMRLEFYPLPGNNDPAIPILREIFGQAGKQLMEIRVWGSLRQPQASVQYVPTVDAALKEFLSGEVPGGRRAVETLRRLLRLPGP